MHSIESRRLGGRAAGTSVLDAPAKLNLFLEVLRRRDDGWHELESVMQTVILADRVLLTPSAEGPVRLSCDDLHVGPAAENLAFRAACLMRQTFHRSDGVDIRLEKRVPVGAGLGGGSSDAAAVLKELNRSWQLGCDGDRLRELGATLGADVPFFITGGAALVRGKGERVCPIELDHTFHYVLVVPDVVASTRRVYGALRRGDLQGTRRDAAGVIEALSSGSPEALGRALFNRLEDVTCRLLPEIVSLKQRLLDAGCLGAAMTGSGAGVFGVTSDEEHAASVASALAATETPTRVFALSTC